MEVVVVLMLVLVGTAVSGSVGFSDRVVVVVVDTVVESGGFEWVSVVVVVDVLLVVDVDVEMI